MDVDSDSVPTTAGKDPIVIVVAHGSRAAAANDAHRELCIAVAERLGLDTRPAFLELAEPSIPEAVDAAIGSGATRLVVHPMFLLPGNHIGRDIPDAIEAAKQRHPGVTIELTPHAGADGLDALVARSVERHLASVSTHGPHEPGRLDP